MINSVITESKNIRIESNISKSVHTKQRSISVSVDTYSRHTCLCVRTLYDVNAISRSKTVFARSKSIHDTSVGINSGNRVSIACVVSNVESKAKELSSPGMCASYLDICTPNFVLADGSMFVLADGSVLFTKD